MDKNWILKKQFMRSMQKGILSEILWNPHTKGLQSLQIPWKSFIILSLSQYEAFLELPSSIYFSVLFPKHIPLSFMKLLSSNYSMLTAENFQSLSSHVVVYGKMTQNGFLSFQI